MKYNPFSCLVLGKNELELTIRENEVKIKYNEVDESAFIEELQENFQKINGLKVKSFEFLMV